MPLYEYVCSRCNDRFELLVRGNETPVCPDCGSKSVRQQLSVVSAHTSGKSSAVACEAPMPAGCGLPQCGMGRCGMQ